MAQKIRCIKDGIVSFADGYFVTYNTFIDMYNMLIDAYAMADADDNKDMQECEGRDVRSSDRRQV